MKVLIAAPVYKRDWILPYWFKAIEQQTFPLDSLGFIFEAGPNDEETLSILHDWHRLHPEVAYFDVRVNITEVHQDHPEGQLLEDGSVIKNRNWNYDRYLTMATLRNNLLDRATCLDFDRYFSLDTDILLEDPETITELANLTRTLPAVAPLMFMTDTGKKFPSVMSWYGTPGKKAHRTEYPLGTLFQADVIMAAKMMSSAVYRTVRYRWHRQGEDLGWSDEARRRGFNLWSASYLYAPHIMHRHMLKNYLQLGDTRGYSFSRS